MDFQVIQALHETRSLADEHADEEGWRDLRDQVDGIIDRLSDDADDTSHSGVGTKRMSRPDVTPPEAERAVAALMAVHELPDDRHLDLARDAVQDLDDAI